jgi:predicted RNase H-like HicB family nuclease
MAKARPTKSLSAKCREAFYRIFSFSFCLVKCVPLDVFKKRKRMNFTAIIEKSDDGWYVGQLEELPAVLSQGKTVDELKENLLDALQMLLDANKEATSFNYTQKNVIRELLTV